MRVYAFIVLCVTLAGCAHIPDHSNRTQAASKLAATAGMHETQLNTLPFTLEAYARTNAKANMLRIYIEGDGLAWISSDRPSTDPTPVNPVALELAVQDTAPAVAYLARPCQYIRSAACHSKYWTSDRTAPEVIDAMNNAVDELKAQANVTSIELVGFSGGGTVAALVAERRKDVTSLRTVAGNLDPDLHSRIHSISPQRGSLNPVKQAARIAMLPQLHFIGGDDEIVPPAIAESFIAALGNRNCAGLRLIPGVSHLEGWTAKWGQLVKEKPSCQ